MQRFNVITITQTLVTIVFLALIVFSPNIHLIPYIEFHDCQRVLQLLLLGFVLVDAIFANYSKDSITIINSKIKPFLYILLGLAITSTALSIEPRHAVIEVTIFAALCFLALFIARLYRGNPEVFIKALSYALLASIVLYMVSFYVGYFTALAVGKQLIWPLPFHGFSNIRLFQQYQLWGLGLIFLPLLAFELKQKIRIWIYIALSAWWVLLFYAASRGVTLGWICAMLVTASVYRKTAWPFLKMQLITAVIGLIIYFLLFQLAPIWFTSELVNGSAGSTSMVVARTIFRDTTYDRLDLWKVSYVMIKNFPLFGVGPMNFYFYNSFGTHPHNSILQIAAEWGLPSTLIILAILGYSFSCWHKKFKANKIQTTSKLDSNLSVILFFTIIANGAYSLVEGVIVMPISQVLMFTVIGLMIGQYTFGQTVPVNSNRIGFRPIFAGVVLVFMSLSAMPELVRGLTSYERYYQPGERAFSMGPGLINPRIWMQQRRIEQNTEKQKETKDTN
jgi:putative inorganic carbon (hco3(-)) transporter